MNGKAAKKIRRYIAANQWTGQAGRALYRKRKRFFGGLSPAGREEINDFMAAEMRAKAVIHGG